MTRQRKQSSGKAPQFGGDWTEAKLGVIAKYLRGYTTALREQPSKERPFRKTYIDAFAGTGYREARAEGQEEDGLGLLLPDLAEREPQALLDGSARFALLTEPRFDKYIFVERSAARCVRLESLKGEFPALANSIDIRQGEANAEIREICKAGWLSDRAVLFLDPYGMQVEWQTLEGVASTRAIDMWLLFPLGIGVNRLLKRTGDIPVSWRNRLNILLGTEDWYDEFYRVEKMRTIFGGEQEYVIKATMDTIGRYFNERLKTIFAGVADKPGVLRNSANNPLYLLCFAVANQRGAPVALRIANHLLKDLRRWHKARVLSGPSPPGIR
jgi:three-Cys-motif partner protein